MGPRTVITRILVRAVLAMSLITALVISLVYLLNELNRSDPNPALTALLGAVMAYLGTALKDVIQAISSNPTDRKNSEDE